MPVIRRPADEPPLFGDKPVIVFGGIDKEAMRRWQERVRAAKDDAAEASVDSDRASPDGPAKPKAD